MLVPVHTRRQCNGSKKWKWSIRSTTLNHRAPCWVLLFSNFEMLDAKSASALDKNHPEFPVQEEGQPRGTESSERGRFLWGRQISFMIHDYFRVTSAHETVLDYADLFSVTLRGDNVEEFDKRWSCAASCNHLRKQRSSARNYLSSRSLWAESFCAQIRGQFSGWDWKTGAMRPRRRVETRATFFSPTNEWCLPAPSVIKPVFLLLILSPIFLTRDAQRGVKHALEFTVVDRAKRRKAMMELDACVSLLEKCHPLGYDACGTFRQGHWQNWQ